MSVKVHEPVCEDSAQDLYFWFDHFLGDQLKDEWSATGGAGGSAVVVDAQTGGIVRITTDADNGDQFRLSWNDIRSLLVSKKVTIEWRAKLNSVTSVFMQLFLHFDDTHFVGFNLDTNIGVNWFIRARDAGLTSLDSGIVADTDYHIFRVECFPTDEVHYYIDGVETGNSPITVGANIPDEYLQPRPNIGTRENVGKSIDIDYVVVRQER